MESTSIKARTRVEGQIPKLSEWQFEKGRSSSVTLDLVAVQEPSQPSQVELDQEEELIQLVPEELLSELKR
jgi:hypothetical protein